MPALAMGIAMIANAQAAPTPTKVGIIHIQNAILDSSSRAAGARTIGAHATSRFILDSRMRYVLQTLEGARR